MKLTLRNLSRQKGYSFINILGLALGLTCFFIIMIFIQSEIGFDSYHEKANRIYRVAFDCQLGKRMINVPFCMNPFGPTAVREFPEVEKAVRFRKLGPTLLEYKEKNLKFYEEGAFYTDADVFEVFTFPLLKGTPESALEDPFTVVIDEEVAKKFFGQENPIGKILRFANNHNLKVTGVMKKTPHNSHFHPRILASYQTLYKTMPDQMKIWLSLNYYTYLLLEPSAQPAALVNKFPSFLNRHMGEIIKQYGFNAKPYLQSLRDIHLRSHLKGEIEQNFDITYLNIFIAVAFFILLIACINFMNLSTAKSAKRAREIGLRKVLGAQRVNLIRQFLGESLIMSLAAFLLAILMTPLLLPLFNKLSGRELPLGILLDIKILLGSILVVALVGLVSGIYPALFMSAFKPIRVLRSGYKSRLRKSYLRSFLVMVQFSISIILIIGVTIIHRQINFLNNKTLGFNKEDLMVVPSLNQKIINNLESVKNQLKAIPGIIEITAVSQLPGTNLSTDAFIPEGYKDQKPWAVTYLTTDHDYGAAMGIELVEGRFFSRQMATDAQNAILINEAARKELAWSNPLGKTIEYFRGGSSSQSRKVIGVFRDYHFMSLRDLIKPLFILIDKGQYSYLLIKYEPNSLSQVEAALKQIWPTFGSEEPFNFYFLDDSIQSLYGSEQRLSKIIQTFALLAIFIGCLGLFGLAAFTAEQRTKEIGMRKVLGASVPGIMVYLSKEFIRWVFVANLLAWPIAFFIMDNWLHNFAYHVNINIWSFILSAVAALTIAFLTVSYQSFKAAVTNPVDTLKYE
jgi:putative ABC transport system permease protein